MVQHVKDVNHPLVVGERYKVKCLKAKMGGKQSFWLPILCWHIGDLSKTGHYHLDQRFLSDAFYERLNTKPHTVFGVPDKAVEAIEEKVRVCLRQFDVLVMHDQEEAVKFRQVEESCKDRVMEGCLQCPHQGVDLTQVPITETSDGPSRFCPAHGLQWSVKDGRMIKRKGELARSRKLSRSWTRPSTKSSSSS